MITVTKTQLADLDVISEIEHECFSSPWSAKELTSVLQNPAFHSYTATDGNGDVVGYVMLYCVTDEADIVNVAVTRKKRRRGYATLLMAKAMSAAKENGVATLFLECRESNSAARGLYEKIGFSEIGVRKAYYTNPVEDAILMSKKL